MNNKQIIQPVTMIKKLVLEFHPSHKPPEVNDTFFVLFQVIMPKKIEYHFGYATFNKETGWAVPDKKCIVSQWCILPSTKLLL